MTKVLERLLNLLAFLLTANRPVTADEIRMTVAGYDRDNDEAFRRMFERDKDMLRQLGIPIELEATDRFEVEHGYVIPPDAYRMPDPGLTDEERAALWLAAQVVRLGGQPSSPGALFKLGGAPMMGGGEPLAADLGGAPEALTAAFTAVRDRRRLTFLYRGEPRQAAPLGLVHRRGHWYVVGSVDGGETRPFRIDRMTKVESGDEPDAFTRRPIALREAVADLPWQLGEEEMMVELRFDAEVAWLAARQLGGAVEATADGSARATVPVANLDALLGWLVAFEDHAEVVGPPEARDAMVALVEAGS